MVSDILLPLGAIAFAVFCCHRYGWGWEKFLAEANAGEGRRFPSWLRLYCAYVVPLVVFAIFVIGRAASTMLYSWSPSCRNFRCGQEVIIVARLICPEITIIGTESSHAPITPVNAFVPPGPVVTLTTPGIPDILA